MEKWFLVVVSELNKALCLALCVKLLKVHVKRKKKLVQKDVALQTQSRECNFFLKIIRIFLDAWIIFKDPILHCKHDNGSIPMGLNEINSMKNAVRMAEKSHCACSRIGSMYSVDEIQIYASINSYLTDMLMRLKDCTWSFDKKFLNWFSWKITLFYFIVNRKEVSMVRGTEWFWEQF